ncbi:MAG: hypothetical protein ACAH59_09025 [Pseudobdellovibrionaceae bacterium]
MVAHFFKLNRKEKIVICAPPSDFENGKLKDKFLTTYDVHVFKKDKWLMQVFSSLGSTPVRFEQKGGQIYEVTHLNLRGTYHPLFKISIVCEKGECKRKEKTCIFNPSEMSPLSAQEVEKEKAIFTKGVDQLQEVTEGELAQMSIYALTGRKQAFDFFTKMEARPLLPVAGVGFYQNMQSLLNQMNQEGCLDINRQK